jgi:hypothetical protein
VQRLTSHKWTDHLALNTRGEFSVGDLCQVAVNIFDANYVGSVASRFDTKERSTEDTLVHRHAGGTDAVEGSADSGWHKQPRTSVRGIEGK